MEQQFFLPRSAVCLQNGKKKLVELPRQPFGDGRAYGHRDSGNPNDTLAIWKGMFDHFYEESSLAPTFCPFQFHPYTLEPAPGEPRPCPISSVT